MRIESCKTILDSFSPDSILVIQIDTSGTNPVENSILRITGCTMSGEQILNIDDVKQYKNEIDSKINEYNAIIGTDLFDHLIPFLNQEGIRVNAAVAADLQKEWNEIVGTFNSNTGDWNKISLASLAGTYHFRPHPEQYSHEFNKVYAYIFLAEKAADMGSITLKGTRRSQLQIYRRTQTDISINRPVF